MDIVERFRKTLQKIAAVGNEQFPAPTTPEEGVLWSTLDACVEVARQALAGGDISNEVVDKMELLRQQNTELLEALHTIGSVDADMVVPHRMWDSMTPKDCYEAGLLDGAMAVRDAVKTEAWAAIVKATGSE